MISREELREFGASIRDLPPEKRKAAGLQFRKMQFALYAGEELAKLHARAAPKRSSTGVSKRRDRGAELWAHNRGTAQEVIGYKNCIVTPSGTVWGTGLRFNPK